MSNMMAVTTMCSTVIHKDFVHPTAKPVSLGDRALTSDVFSIKKSFPCIPLSSVRHFGRKCLAVHHDTKSCLSKGQNQKDGLFYLIQNRSSLQFKKFIEKAPSMVYGIRMHVKSTSQNNSQKDNLEFVSGDTGKQLKALDSYFSKIHENVNDQQASRMTESDFKDIYSDEYQEKSFGTLGGKMIEDVQKNNFKTKIGFGSLDNYFDKPNTDFGTQNSDSESLSEEHPDTGPRSCENFINEKYQEDDQIKEENIGNFVSLSNVDDDMSTSVFVDKRYEEPQSHDEASDFYMINLLISINVAVFLFAIASPVGNSSLQQLSLPLVYGAKINKLILDGEWWRLVTPMFLHSGFLHVAFSCWALLSFGPQVCRGYGPLTFLLIYILGGVCANVTSFIHTPELTVCGTGPVFGIIGAWLIYQVQNKEVITPEVSENMYWKAVIATALSFLLSNDGQIDEWTHLGAALSGIFYGYFTCPTSQLDNMSAQEGQEEGIALVGQQANPWKSILTFIIFILTLSSLVYVFEPEVDFLELGNVL